jgi:hypothetical protein
MKAATMVPEDQHFILSTLLPGPAQKRLALGIVLGLLVALYQGRLAFPLPHKISGPNSWKNTI